MWLPPRFEAQSAPVQRHCAIPATHAPQCIFSFLPRSRRRIRGGRLAHRFNLCCNTGCFVKTGFEESRSFCTSSRIAWQSRHYMRSAQLRCRALKLAELREDASSSGKFSFGTSCIDQLHSLIAGKDASLSASALLELIQSVRDLHRVAGLHNYQELLLHSQTLDSETASHCLQKPVSGTAVWNVCARLGGVSAGKVSAGAVWMKNGCGSAVV